MNSFISHFIQGLTVFFTVVFSQTNPVLRQPILVDCWNRLLQLNATGMVLGLSHTAVARNLVKIIALRMRASQATLAKLWYLFMNSLTSAVISALVDIVGPLSFY